MVALFRWSAVAVLALAAAECSLLRGDDLEAHAAKGVEQAHAEIWRRFVDPHNIVLCPFAIAVYTLPGETQTTWVSYRQPGGAAARLVQPLLQAITDEAGQ